MKNKTGKWTLLFISVLLSFLLSSCNSTSDSGLMQDKETIINNNSITINNDGSDGAEYAASKGLRCAVSIYCAFERTTSSSFPWNPGSQTSTYYSTGSGVIYKLFENGSAFIITNHHVVYDSHSNTTNGIAKKINVYLYGLENSSCAINATYVGGSANYDIAVLRVDDSDILEKAVNSGAASAVEIGNSDDILPGETVIAIGNPSTSDLGGLSVTKGIVSVTSEYISLTSTDNTGEVSFRVVRADAPINSGNSGGGLYNNRGELMGIVNAKISSSEIENIGYAIPSNVVSSIADNIIDYCYGTDCETVMRVILGITVSVSNPQTYYDNENGSIVCTEDVLIYQIENNSLGKSIFITGDIVKSVSVNDKTTVINRQYQLIDSLLDARVGDNVSFVIVRNGVETVVSLTITSDCLTAY